MASTSLFVMPVSAEEISLVPQKAQYEVDNEEYRAKINEFYGYVPLEDLVVESLNETVNNYDTNICPIEYKWFYKHVFVDDMDFKINIHESAEEAIDGTTVTADSLGLIAEQGRIESIEDEDGYVRKFNDIDIHWNILTSHKKQDENTVNAFLKENGYRTVAVQDENNAKMFYLQFDKNTTTEEILKTDLALYENFGFLPRTVTYEKGRYKLYHDLDYIGMTTEDEIKAGEHNSLKKVLRLRNEGKFDSGVEYHFNPDNKVLLIDGKGTLSQDDGQKIVDTFILYMPVKKAKIIIIGKDVELDKTDSNYDNYGYNLFIFQMTVPATGSDRAIYTYHNSDADIENQKLIECFRKRFDQDVSWYHVMNYIDDTIDPYDILNGKVMLDSDIKEVTTIAPTNTKVTMKGDANLDGMVDLADLTTVAKYNLSHESFPLKNEIAYANADMNGDGKVDGLDTSALIENQLGKKGNE